MIAPLLIVQRVANRSAPLTSNTIVTGNISSFHTSSRGESAGGNRTLPSVYPMGCELEKRRLRQQKPCLPDLTRTAPISYLFFHIVISPGSRRV